MSEKSKNNNLKNNSGGGSGKGQNPRPKFSVYWIYGIIGLAIIGTYFLNMGGKPEEISWQRFEKEILASYDVEKIVIVNKERAEIYIKKDRLSSGKYKDTDSRSLNPLGKTGPQYFFTIGSVEIFDQRLQEAMKDFPEEELVTVTYETRRNFFGEIIGWLLPIFLLVIIWIFIFRRMSAGAGGGGAGNIFNVGKSKARIFDKDAHVKVDFKDVAGLEEAKLEVKEIVDFLKNPKKYTDLGGKIPKGALLVGPPGTGKTLLAKAVAGEANVPFFSISGSDFVEMFVGVGASRVRDLFKQAKEKAPCIVFIDEIDAVGRARGRNPNFGANDERENTLNQLLTEMDGFDTNTGVIILAATNRADVLDRALLRAGRFDRQIHVELPDMKERREIFDVHLRPLKLDKNLDIEILAKQTPGFSGADIANVCNEAALIAARKNKKQVEKQDFLCSALGGRASEEINFKKISTGALNDLERITKLAYAMVSYFGMSDKVGNISFYDSTGQAEFSFNKPYSEKTAELIDEEVNILIDSQYERAKKILRENMEGLKKLAEQLLEKEVIFSEDLEKIFGKRKEKPDDKTRDKKLPTRPIGKRNTSKSKNKTKSVTPETDSQPVIGKDDPEQKNRQSKRA
ncbi:MAG: hypothetical protein AMS27_15110 [Bacteroides sp. SM23_62_1]|nr:MAG: hypothetical protein AMS27_15110 [Bacteroides sp. SM23_62_1]